MRGTPARSSCGSATGGGGSVALGCAVLSKPAAVSCAYLPEGCGPPTPPGPAGASGLG